MSDIPQIPKILDEPLRALIKAASQFREALLLVADIPSVQPVLKEQADVLEKAGRILEQWAAHLMEERSTAISAAEQSAAQDHQRISSMMCPVPVQVTTLVYDSGRWSTKQP